MCVEKSYQSKPESAIIRQTCLHSWPLAGFWELELWEGFYHSLSDKGGLIFLDCAKIWLSTFLLKVLILLCARQTLLMFPTPAKTLGTASLMSIPVDNASRVLSQHEL